MATAIEGRLLRGGPDAFAAARRLPGQLANEIVLQATMWDDPRIMATPEARRLMRAGELGLRLRLEIIEQSGHAAESPVRSANGVRRWLQALVVPWTPRPLPGWPLIGIAAPQRTGARRIGAPLIHLTQFRPPLRGSPDRVHGL